MWILNLCTINSSLNSSLNTVVLSCHADSCAKEKLSIWNKRYFLVQSPPPAGWAFPQCSFTLMKVMPVVFPFPTRCLLLHPQPWRWISAEKPPALPFTHFTHTTSPLSASFAHKAVRARTHKHPHSSKHRSQSSDSVVSKRSASRIWKIFFGESETSQTQLKWKYTSSCFPLMFPFLHFLFISLLVFLSRSVVL